MNKDMGVTAVCISKERVKWTIPNVPLLNYIDNWRPFERKTVGGVSIFDRERIEYLAQRRNAAVEKAIEDFPDTNHIFMIDSYYTEQQTPIRNLISHYDGSHILGGCVWFWNKQRTKPNPVFWDIGTTPEGMAYKPWMYIYQDSLVTVRAVGAAYIYPRPVWQKTKYAAPKFGCEHNYLCEN